MGNPLIGTFAQRSSAIVGPRAQTELVVERVLDNRYKIVAPIGAGGSSQVYLAHDTALNRDVAIKVLDEAATADGAIRRRFVNEARALAKLSHPGIVAVYDVGEVDGKPFIVMEHLGAGSLKQRIERHGPLPVTDAARIAVDIANGLEFAHSRGIIHADLKPANILFDSNDNPKICDFGIARTPQEEADTPQLFATAMYVAPERVEGKQASVPSDVYGLGLLLYEMLIGQPPFTSVNAAVLLRDHVVRAPVPPSHLRPSLPKELDTVVLKALAKQPNLRYHKASEFARAITGIQNLDSALATTHAGVMTEPIRDFVPTVEQSPVVALLSEYGLWIRQIFFGLMAALPAFGLMVLGGFGVVPGLLVGGLITFLGAAGQIGLGLGIAWLVETIVLFLFVPGLAVVFGVLGIWLWARDVRAEQTVMAMAMPVAAPFGLGPALVLTAAAVDGLMGVVTAAWGAIVTVIFAIALGKQSLGAFVSTGFSLEQEPLFTQVRAIETKAAFTNVLQSSSDRFGPLLSALDPVTLWGQLSLLISRLVGADVTAIATVLAWTIAALVVWSVTRVLRTFFDTLLRRPKRWFALYVFAQALGVLSGASVLYLLFVTWGPLVHAPGRTADGVLLVSALVGAVLATAAGVVLSATQRQEPSDEHAPSMAARRLPVR